MGGGASACPPPPPTHTRPSRAPPRPAPLLLAAGEFCPPISAKRRAILVFECGLVNKIKHVEEFETCVYTFKVESPAACV